MINLISNGKNKSDLNFALFLVDERFLLNFENRFNKDIIHMVHVVHIYKYKTYKSSRFFACSSILYFHFQHDFLHNCDR